MAPIQGDSSIHKLPAAAKGYVIAFGSLTLATLISASVIHTFGSHPVLRVPFILAFMLSAWFGYGPGLFAWVLGFFVVPFALNPHWLPVHVDKNNLFMVLIIVVLISRMRQTRERAESHLRSANEDLDRRVKERTADLDRSNTELQRLNDDLNEFAHSASHDLKEPLRMVITFSQLLERKFSTQLGSEGREYLHVIIRGGERMNALLDDLLIYTQVVNTPDELVEGQSATADATHAVQKALENLSASIVESRAEVVTCGNLPDLTIREAHLVQLLQNLIGNAIKYRTEASPRIQIAAEREDRFIRLSVADNGIGIAPEYQKQIFDLFKRLHTAEQYPGTGMGLAICRRIVERYGGSIWVESTPGLGSTFYLRLLAATPKA